MFPSTVVPTKMESGHGCRSLLYKINSREATEKKKKKTGKDEFQEVKKIKTKQNHWPGFRETEGCGELTVVDVKREGEGSGCRLAESRGVAVTGLAEEKLLGFFITHPTRPPQVTSAGISCSRLSLQCRVLWVKSGD